MFHFTKIFLVSTVALLVCACATSQPATEQSGMPNPASVYCEEQGGKVEIRTDSEGGQYGVCIFQDGSECDEWAFYRGECQIEIGMPNPASVFCEEQGGRVEIRTDSEGGQFGVCIFEDGSECDEWAFYRGECQPGKQEVAPLPVSAPSYINDAYGFTLNPSSDWTIEEHDDYLVLRRPGYSVFIGYQWADEEPKPFRTGMPEGDFVDGGTATLLGQTIPKHILVWEGKNKVIDYGGRIKAGDLIFVFYLDGVVTEAVSYNDIDLTPEIIAEVDQIIATLALTSGEIPTLEFNP